MEFLRKLNLFAIALPFLIAVIEWATGRDVILAYLFIALTGFLQLFIAFVLAKEYRFGVNLAVYFTLTASFFLGWWLTDFQDIWFLPPLLALYLTIILYTDYSTAFLKAQWRKLLLVNYAVDPSLLLPYLPAGTEIDNYKGKCYVSLVGFLFQDTRVCDVKIPYHINFEEVNLRFYVTRKDGKATKRGVVFIKEIVPKRAISMIANMLYNENYEALPMRHFAGADADLPKVEYGWEKNMRWNSITATYSPEPLEIEVDTEAEFITEHYFGYTKVGADKTFEYEVTHPRWKQYKVDDCTIDVDFETSYGTAFQFLQDLQPDSVHLAEGSEITVKNKVTVQLT